MTDEEKEEMAYEVEMSNKPLYPEHERLKLIADKSQEIGDFLEWLDINCGYWLAEYDRIDMLQPVRKTKEQILADYFNIDLDKIEKEKREMIASLQK